MPNPGQTRIFYEAGQTWLTGENMTQLTWMIWITRSGYNAGCNAYNRNYCWTETSGTFEDNFPN